MALPMAPVEPQMYHHNQEQDMVEEHGQGPVALDESYGDESYDYGQYGEGYDDGSGIMETSGMVMVGADGNKGQSEILQQLDEIINTKCYREGGINTCSEWGFTTKIMTNMKSHIEPNHMAHIQIKIPCLYCTNVCS